MKQEFIVQSIQGKRALKDTATSEYYGKDNFKADIIYGLCGMVFGLFVLVMILAGALKSPILPVIAMINMIYSIVRIASAKSNSKKRLLKPLLEKYHDKIVLDIKRIIHKEIRLKDIKDIEIKKLWVGTKIKIYIQNTKEPVVLFLAIFDKTQRIDVFMLFEDLNSHSIINDKKIALAI